MFLKSAHFPELPSPAFVDFIILPGMVKLYSRSHRYPASLSKIPTFFIRPILQSSLKCDWVLTSENCFIIGLTVKKGCSLSKVFEVTKLQAVITRLSVARLIRGYFSPQFSNILKHLTLEIGCPVAIDTQQSDVLAYTKCDVQLIKLLLMMD